MMKFIYETDGIKASVETDYDSLDDVLDGFRRFLGAAGYSFSPGDALTWFNPDKEVVVNAGYWAKMTDGSLGRWADWTDEEKEHLIGVWNETMYPDSFEYVVDLAIDTAAKHRGEV